VRACVCVCATWCVRIRREEGVSDYLVPRIGSIAWMQGLPCTKVVSGNAAVWMPHLGAGAIVLESLTTSWRKRPVRPGAFQQGDQLSAWSALCEMQLPPLIT